MIAGTRTERRAGASLVELVVALTILGIGVSLAARTLELATRELESAELGLRAVLLLSELHDSGSSGSIEARTAGPGVLVSSGDEELLRVDYHSPMAGGPAAPRRAGAGYLHPHSWSIPEAP